MGVCLSCKLWVTVPMKSLGPSTTALLHATHSREKKREVLSVMSAATKRQEQALTRERTGDSLASSTDGAMVFTSICSLVVCGVRVLCVWV